MQKGHLKFVLFGILVGISLISVLGFQSIKASAVTNAQVSDIRGLDYEDLGFSNGTHVWTGGLEPWWQAANGTFVPYILTSNSTHVFFDSKQFPFAINKNTCIVTVYDPSKKIAQNPDVVIGKEYWNYGFKTNASSTYTIVDTSSMACTLTQETNSSGYFATAVKSDSNVQLSVTYSKKINHSFETFATVTNLNSGLNGYYFEPVEQITNVNTSQVFAQITPANPTKLTNIPDGIVAIPSSQLSGSSLSFETKSNNTLNLDLTKAINYFSQFSGTKSNGIVAGKIEFGRNGTTLNYGQSITIDPTFGYTTSNWYATESSTLNTSTICPSGNQYRFSPNLVGWYGATTANNNCDRAAFRNIINSIPTGSTVNSVSIQYSVVLSQNWAADNRKCEWHFVTDDPGSASASTIWNDIGSGGVYATSSNCQTTNSGSYYTVSFPASANTDVQNKLTSGVYTIGLKADNEARSSTNDWLQFADSENIKLQIVYTTGGGGGGGSDLTVSGNIVATQPSGTFKIYPQNSGVAICIGTGC